MTENTRSLSSIPFLSRSNQELSTCCNIKCYRIRRVKNKGVVLVLILSFLVTSTLYILATTGVHHYTYQFWLIPFGISTAIAGWLTDTFIGRYKMIRCSVWIMWILMIAVTVSAVVKQLNEMYHHYDKTVRPVLFILISIGLGGFQANIIQLGLDQLHDASTTEITSFITWYVSTLISAGFVVQFNIFCLNEQNKLFVLLLICMSLTLALILITHCNHWLIKEPATQSPLKLIYKVIKFAVVTKHPRCRSAFTYCEDDLPSRIDFGKSKYGGPFTTEQVEDVKTFLRLLPLISIFGLIISVLIASNYLHIYLARQYNQFSGLNLNSELGSRKIIAECYTKTSLTHSVYLGITLLIVLNEFLLYPLCHHYISFTGIKSLWKIILGIVLQVLRVIALMVFDVISRRNFLDHSELNATIHCIFLEKHGLLSQSFSHEWLAVPEYIHHLSLIFILIGIIEFICSQVPYSMKGVIIGAQYALILVLLTPTVVIVALTKVHFSIWGQRIISCEFWYALVCLAANFSIFFILTWMAKRYKMRKREDLLPNEHFFAERYYSQ